jgi:hypothetical protein
MVAWPTLPSEAGQSEWLMSLLSGRTRARARRGNRTIAVTPRIMLVTGAPSVDNKEETVLQSIVDQARRGNDEAFAALIAPEDFGIPGKIVIAAECGCWLSP